MDEDISNINGYEQIAECLGCDKVEPDDILEMLNDMDIDRQTDIHIGNMHAQILLTRIKLKLENTHPDLDVTYYVNAMDTHLNINGEKVYTIGDVNEVMHEEVTDGQ